MRKKRMDLIRLSGASKGPTTVLFQPDLVRQREITSTNAVFATACAGSGLATVNSTPDITALLGASWTLQEVMTQWDTSVIPAGATILSATIYATVSGVLAPAAFTAFIAAFDWGSAVAVGDWQDTAELTALTNMASLTSAAAPTPARYAMASLAGLIPNIVKGGLTKVCGYLDALATGVAPGASTGFQNSKFELEVTWR